MAKKCKEVAEKTSTLFGRKTAGSRYYNEQNKINVYPKKNFQLHLYLLNRIKCSETVTTLSG